MPWSGAGVYDWVMGGSWCVCFVMWWWILGVGLILVVMVLGCLGIRVFALGYGDLPVFGWVVAGG